MAKLFGHDGHSWMYLDAQGLSLRPACNLAPAGVGLGYAVVAGIDLSFSVATDLGHRNFSNGGPDRSGL